MPLKIRRFATATSLVFATVAASISACDEESSPITPTPPPVVEPDSSAGLPEDSDTIPCAPRYVLQTVCQQCHQRPTKNGAPFSLVNRSDITRRNVDGEIRELMIQQVEARRMPQEPVTIDDGSRAVLLEWLRSGAPGVSPQACLSDGGTLPSDSGSDAEADADAEPPADADAEPPADAGADADGGPDADAGDADPSDGSPDDAALQDAPTNDP